MGGEAGGGLDQCGMLGQVAVRVDQTAVGSRSLIGGDHRLRSLAQQRGAARSPNSSDLVESADQVVIELYEHLSASR